MGDRIFRLFQRGVMRSVEGTGAGLAIVRQIVERHGGAAWARPREGGGSEFVVTFGPARGDRDALDEHRRAARADGD
jgi:signal transduction histidine kinase